jgi:hypothetical protein
LACWKFWTIGLRLAVVSRDFPMPVSTEFIEGIFAATSTADDFIPHCRHDHTHRHGPRLS